MEQQPKTAQNKKSKWLIPAIIVVGIIFLGVGSWASYNHWVKSTQQPPQEQPKDEFADWQTYRNEDYGFEFKLPPKWKDVVIEQIHDEFYNGEIFLLKLEGSNICDISAYSSEAWGKYQAAETTGKPIYLISKGDLIFSWGCGQDDYGYKGFEDFNKAIDDGNFEAINSGKILGPFAEFKSLILPTFKFIESKQGFCGQSTKGSCNADNDCVTGGCSGQVCQSKSEEPIITTCEYRDCYNAAAYNLTCGCKNNQCQWK